MVDIGIIARRLSPDYVQYGWSGNGCNYKSSGSILQEYYNTPELVEYLFGLGQLSLLFTPYSEKENDRLRDTPTGKPHWVGQSEREIFSKIMFMTMAISTTAIRDGIMLCLDRFGLRYRWN